MTSADFRPFLPIVVSTTRGLGAALPNVVTAAVTSPWSPAPAASPPPAPVAVGPSSAELAAMFDEARTQGRAEGRAEGHAETAELRARLTHLIDELAAARAQVVPPAAELITEVASCVIEAWLETADPSERFAPIVRGWVARAPGQPATVRVHPGDVAALTAAIGDAVLTIAPDPALAPGALAITSPALELNHDWRARLPDLRTAIASALSGAEPGAEPGSEPGVEPGAEP
jgi:flagellar biosynthesis/type III secretory pathway protein FliH